MSLTREPSTVVVATIDSPSRFHPSKRQTSARWSSTHQPTLCRVASYCRPGLPSPRMTFKRSLLGGFFLVRLPGADHFGLHHRLDLLGRGRLDDSARRRNDADRGVFVRDLDSSGKIEIAHVNRAADGQLSDVDFDVVRNVRRVHFDLELACDLVEHSTIESHSCGHSHQHDRNTNGHLLTGDELLKIDVEDLALEGVTLDLPNESA